MIKETPPPNYVLVAPSS